LGRPPPKRSLGAELEEQEICMVCGKKFGYSSEFEEHWARKGS